MLDFNKDDHPAIAHDEIHLAESAPIVAGDQLQAVGAEVAGGFTLCPTALVLRLSQGNSLSLPRSTKAQPKVRRMQPSLPSVRVPVAPRNGSLGLSRRQWSNNR